MSAPAAPRRNPFSSSLTKSMNISDLTKSLTGEKPKIPADAFTTQFLPSSHSKSQSSQFKSTVSEKESLPKNLPKTADVYSFDDLLVACAHEIIIHGMDTKIVPEGIKDWVAGKLVRAMKR